MQRRGDSQRPVSLEGTRHPLGRPADTASVEEVDNATGHAVECLHSPGNRTALLVFKPATLETIKHLIDAATRAGQPNQLPSHFIYVHLFLDLISHRITNAIAYRRAIQILIKTIQFSNKIILLQIKLCPNFAIFIYMLKSN